MIYKEINKCRICGNNSLVSIIDLGNQFLTGVFPAPGEKIERGPLEIVKCLNKEKTSCGLVQLRHDYEMEKLYGDNYGYRSGLNKSMVDHLASVVKKIEDRVDLKDDDLVIDIASNDGTLLSCYKNFQLDLLGIDPTLEKFKEYYRKGITMIPDFFSRAIIDKYRGGKKAKVITSIAMFYDLPDPLEIMRQIESILADDGIWVSEQSYMPDMIKNISYDTICHEHLEFYALKQFKWMADKANLKIIDIELNRVNGASLAITFAKNKSIYQGVDNLVLDVLNKEVADGFDELAIYQDFVAKTEQHKEKLLRLLSDLKRSGKKVLGYGASTKGNVILQYCGLTKEDIPCIADVNEYKFGRLTPGTEIPIVSESEAKKLSPDYFLVLPWHFKDNIIAREQEFIKNGGHLIFPLPEIEIV
jgi:hypothetical protein